MAGKTTSSAILASLSPQEILDFQVRNGMIDLDDVKASIVDTERKKILKAHPYAISHGKDGRWRTWVPDKNAKDGRKKIAKSTKEKIEEAVICYYLENDEELRRKRMTLRDLYPEWLEYKRLHSSETTIPRVDSDWKKYYENDPDSIPIIDKRIRELTKIELDEWIHKLIRKYDMTKTLYYNVSLIIRQMLDYAEELEIVEENLFRKVKIDSKRMFRKVHKKKDCTQVYTKDEVILIYQEAWNDFRNSKRLVYRLAPLAVMFQFQTGLRLGELCALKFEDVENGVLHVVRMLQRDSDKVVEHTKSHEDRDVLLTDAALELIEVARAYQEEHGGKGEYIFSMTEEALSYAETNILLKKYCKRLNILYRSSHKSRKTYISSLIDAGININTIRSYAGHADERTTYFNYCFDRAPDTEKKMLLEKALETPLPS